MLEQVRKARPDAELHGLDISDVKTLNTSPLVTDLVQQGRFYQANIVHDHSVPQRHFDLVYSSMVLEHVPDAVDFIRAMGTLARPGGHVFVHTVNHRSILTSFYNDPTHIRPYPPAALERAAHFAGLKTEMACNERSLIILAMAPFYRAYCTLTGRQAVIPFFWEHLLAIQSVLVATVPPGHDVAE